jgi:hypothetical protein
MAEDYSGRLKIAGCQVVMTTNGSRARASGSPSPARPINRASGPRGLMLCSGAPVAILITVEGQGLT